MATRAATVTYTDNGKVIVTWTGLLQSSSDVGAAIGLPPCTGLTAQLSGTLGTGGAITMQGSNDGTNWGAVQNTAGSDSVVDAIGEMSTIESRPLQYRPNVTAGNGTTNLTLILVGQLI